MVAHLLQPLSNAYPFCNYPSLGADICKTGESSMVGNVFGADVYPLPSSFLPDRAFQPRPALLPEPCEDLSLSNFCLEWMAFAQVYSWRSLSDWTERLPAIGALAQRFQDETGWEYCAGLWRHRILVFLSWRRLDTHSIRLKDVVRRHGPGPQYAVQSVIDKEIIIGLPCHP
jgi:hypothetical protein